MFPSASVLKAMLLVAYAQDARDRPLRRDERALLAPMVRRSDNAAASTIFTRLGTARLERLARDAGMTRFTGGLADLGQLADHGARPDPLLPAHRRAAAAPRTAPTGCGCCGRSCPVSAGGIGRLDLPDWRVYFKGGWGAGTGAVDHQVALLRRGDERIAIAVLTANNGSHAAGKRTLEGVFRRLLEGLG